MSLSARTDVDYSVEENSYVMNHTTRSYLGSGMALRRVIYRNMSTSEFQNLRDYYIEMFDRIIKHLNYISHPACGPVSVLLKQFKENNQIVNYDTLANDIYMMKQTARLVKTPLDSPHLSERVQQYNSAIDECKNKARCSIALGIFSLIAAAVTLAGIAAAIVLTGGAVLKAGLATIVFGSAFGAIFGFTGVVEGIMSFSIFHQARKQFSTANKMIDVRMSMGVSAKQ